MIFSVFADFQQRAILLGTLTGNIDWNEQITFVFNNKLVK